MKITVTNAYEDNPKFISLHKSYGINNGDEFEVLTLFEDIGFVVVAPTGGDIIILRSEAVESDSNIMENYDSPYTTEWTVAVDIAGNVSILKAPNLHPGFSENGKTALDYGLPEDVTGTAPGVYRWTCSFHEEKGWESGLVEDWHFEVESEVLILSV